MTSAPTAAGPGGAQTCAACGAAPLAFSFDAPDLRDGRNAPGRYLRCASCGTLALERMLSEGALSEAYESGVVDPVTSVGPADLRTSLRPAARLLRALSQAATGRPHSLPQGDGAGRTLLDVGCLGGDKLVDFARRGFRVTGVDLNTAAIARARQLLPMGTFHDGPLDSLPPQARFDFIRCDNVLEHIPDPLSILREVRSRLAPGGRAFFYVPSGEALSVRLLAARSVNVWVPWHLHLFSRSGLALLCARAGFTEVRVEPFTPLSWWKENARQLVAAPGWFRRPPDLAERAAVRAAQALMPAFFLLGKTGVAEEWVVTAGGGPPAT